MQKTMTPTKSKTKTMVAVALVALSVGGVAFGVIMLNRSGGLSLSSSSTLSQSQPNQQQQQIQNQQEQAQQQTNSSQNKPINPLTNASNPTPIPSKCVESPFPSPLPAVNSNHKYSKGKYRFGRYFTKGYKGNDRSKVNLMAYMGGTFDLKENGEIWYAAGIPKQFAYLKPNGKGGHTLYDLKGKAYGTMMLYKMPGTYIGSKFNERTIHNIARYTPIGENDSIQPYNDGLEYGIFFGPLGIVMVSDKGEIRDDYNIIYKARRNPGIEGGFEISDLSGKVVAILGADFSRDNLLTYTIIKNFAFPEEYCLKYL